MSPRPSIRAGLVSIARADGRAAAALALVALISSASACGGDDDGGPGPLFPPVEECDGQAIAPLEGDHPMVLSSLKIAEQAEGFDLDKDGEPDNQMAGIGAFADPAFEDQFKTFGIVLPLEFFDLAEPGPDDCVKFAVYIGEYRHDGDGDGAATVAWDGDCNDAVATIAPGSAEVAGNRIDDDCDGLADEVDATPSADDTDQDGDTVSLADGDCDDTRADVALGLVEICGDGLDNDCDGAADWTGDENATPVCTPYDDATPDPLLINPDSLDDAGAPKVAFAAAKVAMIDGALHLTAGPALFQVDVPLSVDIDLSLKISGASIEGDLVMTPGGWGLADGRLGGVIDARTADAVRGIAVEQVDLKPEDSLLDATFANLLAVLLGLQKAGGEGEFADCFVPDIDVDGDGIEIFCDSDPADDIKTVDVCVDGDGTVVRDGDDGNLHCTDGKDAGGAYRFQDGISIALTLSAVPATLSGLLGD